jgi:hypothetical protein
MKLIISLLFFFFGSVLIAQTVTFTPEWKKGDFYEVSMNTEERKWSNDTLTEEDSYFVDPTMEVLSSSKKNIQLQVTFTDVFMEAFSDLQETIGYDPKGLELILIYDINPVDGSYELTNIESAKKFIGDSMEELRREMKAYTEDEEKKEMVDVLVDMMKGFFGTDMMISSYFNSTLDSMLEVYYQPLELGKPIRLEEKDENPFSPGDTLSVVTILTLKELKGDIALIQDEKIMDMEEYMQLILPMIQGMIEGFAEMDTTATQEEIDEVSRNMEEEMSSMTMDCTVITDIELNTKTTWLKTIRSKTSIIMNMGPITNERREVVNTITFTRK